MLILCIMGGGSNILRVFISANLHLKKSKLRLRFEQLKTIWDTIGTTAIFHFHFCAATDPYNYYSKQYYFIPSSFWKPMDINIRW